MHGHDCPPCCDQDSHVDRWAIETLEKDVARDLEKNVWHEEQGQDDIPLDTADAKVDINSFNLGVADVGSIQVCNEV